MFLDDEDTDLPGTEFYQTQPYASGRAFAASVLDLLMITSFFNPTITKVIHTIIFGGASLELERIMAEGAGLIGGPNISKQAEIKDQVSIVQESVEGSPLSIHAVSRQHPQAEKKGIMLHIVLARCQSNMVSN